MKMVLLSHSLSVFTPNHHHHAQNLNTFRNRGRVLVQLRNCGLYDSDKTRFNSTSSQPISQNAVLRRDFLLFGLSTSLLSVFPSSSSCADEALKMGSMVDEINAYSYLYPLEFPSKKLKFQWAESRKPERYSSAAPLSPDARLRIVSERVNFKDNMVISVTIGPPNSRFIKSPDKTTWTAKDVADSVLSDKSALVDGEPYWYYEYLIRKSPTKSAQDSNNFRHYVAATAERDGYLYTMNASTLDKQWNSIGPLLQKTVVSFRLDAPTEEYVPPYKDPWRFW